MPKYKDLIGMKFFKLTVVGISEKKKNPKLKYWDCICECGNKVSYSTSDLLKSNAPEKNKVKSCGCLKKENAKKLGNNNFLGLNVANINYLYSGYKNRSKRKKLDFNIDWYDFLDLIQNNCYYCDSPPSNSMMWKNGDKSKYTYNGIDRLNSKFGYVPGNIVTCCARCNYSKLDYTKEEFFNMIKKIYEKHNLEKL